MEQIFRGLKYIFYFSVKFNFPKKRFRINTHAQYTLSRDGIAKKTLREADAAKTTTVAAVAGHIGGNDHAVDRRFMDCAAV